MEAGTEKIVVTGSTGLVGSHLVAELMRGGHTHITLPVRNRKRLEQLYKTLAREGVDASRARFNIVETGLNNPIELARAFEGSSTVFNCAATVSLGGIDARQLIQTNVEITQHVVNACLKAGVAKLVHVSSIAALGEPHEGELYADEDTVMESLARASAYSASKFLSEQEVRRGSYEGLQTVVVNPCAIIGTGDWQSGSSVMIPLLAKGVPVYTEGVTAWVDVRDVARAMVLLSRTPQAVGRRFVLAGHNASFREVISIANKAAGKRPPRLRARRWMLNAARGADRALSLVCRRTPLFTADVAALLLGKSYYRGEKIKKTVTFEYTPLEQTLSRVIGDYLNEKRWTKQRS